MSALIGLALNVFPDLAKFLFNKNVPKIDDRIVEVIRNVVGSDDPAKVAAILADPKVATDLRVKLAEIYAEASAKERQVELETIKAELADTKDARGTLATLAGQGSIFAWGPVIVSGIVVLGFFVMLLVLIGFPASLTAADEQIKQIVNISVGALTAGFATVISFWLGSSQGSRDKDGRGARPRP